MRVYLKRFSIFVLIFTFVFSMLSFTLPVDAALNVAPDNLFSMPCLQPEVTDNTGYIVLMMEDDNSTNRWLCMFNWSYFIHIAKNDNGFDDGHVYYNNSFVDITLSPSSVTFEPISNTTYNYTSFCLSRFYFTGSSTIVQNESLKKGTITPYTYSPSGAKIVGYQVFGNYGNITESLPTTLETFGIVWSDDYAAYNQLLELQALLGDLYSVNDYMSLTLDDIFNECVGISLNTDELEDLLGQIKSTLHSDLVDIKDYLKDIIDILEGKGQDSLEKPPDESVNDALDKEDELLGNDISDAENEIDIQIDTSASDSIWGIINMFLNLNPIVFGFYITILSLGILILILNR